MSRWFRFYDDALNDPKVQRLPGDKFKTWVNLLCLASKHDGILPPLPDVSFALRINEERLSILFDEFYRLQLLDEVEVADAPMSYCPHNWNTRQYKSDVTDPTAAKRQKAYRDRNADRNATVTDKRPETETETETEQKQKDNPTVAKPTRRDEQFEEFWKAYPRRDGANPKSPAEKLFLAAVKGGEPPENIILGARVCATLEQKHVGTPFIPQAVKWLRDKRWRDYQEPIAVKLVTDWDAICSSFKKFGHWSKWEGPPPGSVGCRCPVEILDKHGIEFHKLEATP